MLEDQSRYNIFRASVVYPVFKALQLYHKYSVEGLDNIPTKGRVIIAVNHSMATYDAGLLYTAIHDGLGRTPRSLGDRLIFKIPKFSEFMVGLGVVEGSHENARQLLGNEELVFVAPGGMREALRPTSERYQLMWERRLGFAKLAMETQTPIILAMCPYADDLFHIAESNITKILYKEFKLPLPLARGLGYTVIPRPIRLTHHISKPIKPPKLPDCPEKKKAALARFHARICRLGQAMMNDAVSGAPIGTNKGQNHLKY